MADVLCSSSSSAQPDARLRVQVFNYCAYSPKQSPRGTKLVEEVHVDAVVLGSINAHESSQVDPGFGTLRMFRPLPPPSAPVDMC